MEARKMCGKALWCTAAIIVMGALVAGCGGGDEMDYGTATLKAKDIDDGATPLVPNQHRCPVSGAPINPDVHNGSEDERVYFANEECMLDWKSDKEAMMANLEIQKEGPWNPDEEGFPSAEYEYGEDQPE